MIEVENEIILSPSLNEGVFGPICDGPEVGRVALFEGGLVRNVRTGELFEGDPIVGVIVGVNDYDAAILEIDGRYFLGWVTKDRYRVLNLVHPDKTTVH